MANLLFKLNNVPDDEAEEIRLILDEAEIDYYETTSGNWGLFFAAIWLKNDKQLAQAKELIKTYQQERFTKAKAEQQAKRESGEQLSWLQAFKNHPIKIIAVIIFSCALMFFSTLPFYSM